uniref:Uncharacterized protein n=1 Tax=Arundo donax TaxID=35708 RepID=A0A0A9CYW0_ARUDO
MISITGSRCCVSESNYRLCIDSFNSTENPECTLPRFDIFSETTTTLGHCKITFTKSSKITLLDYVL